MSTAEHKKTKRQVSVLGVAMMTILQWSNKSYQCGCENLQLALARRDDR